MQTIIEVNGRVGASDMGVKERHKRSDRCESALIKSLQPLVGKFAMYITEVEMRVAFSNSLQQSEVINKRR